MGALTGLAKARALYEGRVFAQREVAQYLAESVPLEEVLAGLHAALASRIHRMVRRLQVEQEVILTGGGAKNPAVVRFVVVDGNRAFFAVLPSQGNYLEVAEEALARTLRSAGIEREDLGGLAAAGLGAPKLPLTRQVSDISCLAKGISRLGPAAEPVIDIGGQATRVIRLGPAGIVKNFTASGQCAAGSARLLEIIAHLLGVEVGELGELSLREDLLAGVHQSLARKIVALARGAGPSGNCALAGGGARDQGLVAQLRAAMGSVVVPPEPMVVAALGAALLAAEGGG